MVNTIKTLVLFLCFYYIFTFNNTKFNELCFPVTRASFQRIAVNWGGSRRNGAGCHTGIDIFTKSPGVVVSVASGIVTHVGNYITCKNGWGCNGGCGNGKQTKTVMIYHPTLQKTFNYGEIDDNQVSVSLNQNVKAGQVIGKRNGYCGMLHFEVYNGRQNRYDSSHTWTPPPGQTVTNPDKCARLYLNRKPKNLEDPRPWILSRLNGKFCK
jgi:murein DD-endopeptidase MepM/ murein hydrolase activator NlpD